MSKSVILGAAASLRNARKSDSGLCDLLREIPDEEALVAFLDEQGNRHSQRFAVAGRRERLEFEVIHANLDKTRDQGGLSNSEAGLAAALWAARQCADVDIEHLSLSDHFPVSGEIRQPDVLRRRLLGASGLIVATPVYFGDRSSLAQALYRFIAVDPELVAHFKDRVIAGISVGAKRNGGQETTLIYQILDYVRLGMVGVGNDAETTSQYGGTCHAGDVGTISKDLYGLRTSMGVGRRVATLTEARGRGGALGGKTEITFLLLQDTPDGKAAAAVRELVARHGDEMHARILDITDMHIRPCLACDFCPHHIGPDSEFRCAVKNDAMRELHDILLSSDALVPVFYAAADIGQTRSNYQQFTERTRYLRRGDYVLSNRLLAPLVFQEPGGGEYLEVRSITSFIRQAMLIYKPFVVHLQQVGEITITGELRESFADFLNSVRNYTVARYLCFADSQQGYNPVGYVLKMDRAEEDARMQLRRAAMQARAATLLDEASRRLLSGDGEKGVS